MVDFASSLKKGISAAQDAERNRAEISAVFAEMNAQLNGETEGKIIIERAQFEDPSVLPPTTLVNMFFRDKYWAIAVRHAVHKSFGSRELAKWKQGPAGYPCWITTADAKLACENKEALELGLADLISSPAAGEIIYGAIKFEPKPIKPST